MPRLQSSVTLLVPAQQAPAMGRPSANCQPSARCTTCPRASHPCLAFVQPPPGRDGARDAILAQLQLCCAVGENPALRLRDLPNQPQFVDLAAVQTRIQSEEM